MLVKPIPQVEESPKSLLSRYASGNFYPSVRLALGVREENSRNSRGFLFGGLNEVKHFASQLEGSMQVDLEKWFYGQAAGFTDESPVIWNGCEVPWDFFIPSRVRICPCCIGHGFVHQSADFGFFSSCPIHRVKLHDVCGGCKRSIQWSHGSIDRCLHCDFQFKALEEVPVSRPSENLVMDWVRSGDKESFNRCMSFLRALRSFYSKEVFQSGVLLDVAVKLSQGQAAGLLELLAPLYPPGIVPHRLILAPLFLSCGSDSEDIKNKLAALFPGVVRRSGSGGSNPSPGKQHLRVHEVEFALNISSQTRRKLVEHGFLNDAQKLNGLRQVATASVIKFFSLLNGSMIQSVTSPMEKWDRFGASVLNNTLLVSQGKATLNLHDWSNGCAGLWIKPIVKNPRSKPDGLLNINDFAKAANTYPDAIRRVVKAGIVSPDPRENSKAGAGFTPETVESFCKQYCFSSEIAQQTQMGRTIISAVLSSVGIEPISGPKVDGALVPLYKRSDLEGLDVRALIEKKEYKSNAGRKKEGTVLYDSETWMASKEVSAILDFCPLELSSAVSQGYLKVGVPDGRESDNHRYYLRTSVEAFRQLIDSAIPISKVPEKLGISKTEFYKRFVYSNFVQIMKVGKQSWLPAEDFLRAEQDCQLYVGTETATKLTGAPFRHFQNLINTDRISKVSSSETITATCFNLIRRRDIAIHAVKAPGSQLKAGLTDEVESRSLKIS